MGTVLHPNPDFNYYREAERWVSNKLKRPSDAFHMLRSDNAILNCPSIVIIALNLAIPHLHHFLTLGEKAKNLLLC